MSKQTEALKLALENAQPSFYAPGWTLVRNEDIAAIRKALAEQPAQGCEFCSHPLYAGTKCKNCGREQPAIKQDLTPEQPAQQQEPVGRIVVKSGCAHFPISMDFRSVPDGEYNLYTSPPASKPWVGLTAKEAVQLWNDAQGDDTGGADRFARAIEAKLREKNT